MPESSALFPVKSVNLDKFFLTITGRSFIIVFLIVLLIVLVNLETFLEKVGTGKLLWGTRWAKDFPVSSFGAGASTRARATTGALDIGFCWFQKKKKRISLSQGRGSL